MMCPRQHERMVGGADMSLYRIEARTEESPTTVTLSLANVDGTVPVYRAGQYLTIYFPDFSKTLGKQYSISSMFFENVCAITVKAIGRFSGRLCSLSRGEHVLASKPHGSFYPTRNGNVVLIAGGMGITPFRGIVLERLRGKTASTRLLYSAKTRQDMPFGNELHRLSQKHPSFRLTRFLTQESGSGRTEFAYRRMRMDDIVEPYDREKTEFLVSGSLDFVLGLKNSLIAAGIRRERILSEARS